MAEHSDVPISENKIAIRIARGVFLVLEFDEDSRIVSTRHYTWRRA